LAKFEKNSPVATGQNIGKIAKNSDFWLKWPKMAILRGSAPKRGFCPFLGLSGQGFYINPSRRGPAPGRGVETP